MTEMAPGMWNAILKWSLAQHDGTTDPKDIKPMSEEDKKFLSDAMASMVVDEIGEMKKIIATLKLPEAVEQLRIMYDQAELKHLEVEETKDDITDEQLQKMVVQKKEEALEDLEDYIVGIDRAQDLHRIEGLAPLLRLLHSNHPSIRWRACSVLGTVVQNNPKSQQWATELKAVESLLAHLAATRTAFTNNSMDSDLKECLAKGFYSLSGLLRHFDPAMAVFLQQHGISALLAVVRDPSIASVVLRKSLLVLELLLDTQISKSNTTSAVFAEPDVLNALTRAIGNHQDIMLREGCLRVLLLLASTPEGISAVQSAVLSRCEERAKEIAECSAEDVDMLEDEQRHLTSLLAVLQGGAATATARTAEQLQQQQQQQSEPVMLLK